MEYDWGDTDFIPDLLGKIPDGKPKAELWMGAHEAAPALVIDQGGDLKSYISDHYQCLGEKSISRFGKELPLLFKVLAIAKPLSIQCHPSTELAREGWAKETAYRKTVPRSQWNYKDPNRKAEIIYALTPITAMCGFRPVQESLPLLQNLIPQGYETFFLPLMAHYEGDALLAKVFEQLYTMEKVQLRNLIGEMISRLSSNPSLLPAASKDAVFLESRDIIISCHKEYPEDPGLFCPVLLNIVHLCPGEALYLAPRTLHAYVYGNGMELMSASDNVLRGGLTHKKMDVPELLKVLSVKSEIPSKAGEHYDSFGRTVVESPAEEFSLVVMPAGKYEVFCPAFEILFVEQGSGSLRANESVHELHQGDCLLIASGTQYAIELTGRVFCATIKSY
jgi:mannose-6-phosphate isomerase